MGKFQSNITVRLVIFFEHEDFQPEKQETNDEWFQGKANVDYTFIGVSALSEPGEWRF
jgi:hypothetical protein